MSNKALARRRVQEGTLLRSPTDRYAEWQRDYPHDYPLFLQQMLKARVAKLAFPITTYGFECGPGWAGILKKLFDTVEARLRDLPVLARRNHQAAQVKEKFGKLEVYIIGYPPDRAIDAAIRHAKRESGVTCERCGEPGETISSPATGWVVTRCPEHARNHARTPDVEETWAAVFRGERIIVTS